MFFLFYQPEFSIYTHPQRTLLNVKLECVQLSQEPHAYFIRY